MEMYRIKGRKVGMHRISREEGRDAQDQGRRVGMHRSGGQKFSTVPQIKGFPR